MVQRSIIKSINHLYILAEDVYFLAVRKETALLQTSLQPLNEKSPLYATGERKAFSSSGGVGEISNFELVKDLAEVIDFLSSSEYFL